jgi:hypothetical protein
MLGDSTSTLKNPLSTNVNEKFIDYSISTGYQSGGEAASESTTS